MSLFRSFNQTLLNVLNCCLHLKFMNWSMSEYMSVELGITVQKINLSLYDKEMKPENSPLQ